MNSIEKTFESGRLEIAFEEFYLDKVVDVELEGGECIYIQIPLKRTVNNKIQYNDILNNFINEYVKSNSQKDIIENPVVINLVIDGDKYFLNTFIEINHFGCIDNECLSYQIQISDLEQAQIDIALLKFTNPKEYLIQYNKIGA